MNSICTKLVKEALVIFVEVVGVFIFVKWRRMEEAEGLGVGGYK